MRGTKPAAKRTFREKGPADKWKSIPFKKNQPGRAQLVKKSSAKNS